MSSDEKHQAPDWRRFRAYTARFFTALSEKGGVTGESVAGRFAIHASNVFSAMEVVRSVMALQDNVAADSRYDFRESTTSLILAATMLAGFAARAIEKDEIAPEIEGRLSLIEGAVLDLVNHLDEVRQARHATALGRHLKGEEDPTQAADKASLDELISRLMRLLALVVTCRRIAEEYEAGENETGDAARMRRLRERRRRGVAYHTQIDIYADDLDLLWRMGFLSAGDKDDREAVARAMEAFILHAFLMLPDSVVSFSDRMERQQGRLQAVLGRRP